MTRREQKQFVRDLAKHVADDVIASILSGSLPEEWDGHELRCLLAEKFKDAASHSLIRRYPRSRRTRSYNNTRMTTNV